MFNFLHRIVRKVDEMMYLRFNRNRSKPLDTGWWMSQGSRLSMDIAIEFVIYIVISLIFQRVTTGGTLETLSVQILVLYADKHTTVIFFLGLVKKNLEYVRNKIINF